MSFFNKLIEYKNKTPFYTELEYIESTDTQYIDIDFTPDSTTKFSIDLQYTNLNSSVYMVNGKSAYDGNSRCAIGYDYNLTWYWGIADKNLRYGTIDDERHTIWLDLLNSSYGIDDLSFTDTFSWSTTTGKISLFCRNNGGNSRDGYCKCKIYGSKLYTNGTLVMDLIPVLDENDTPCLFDLISKKFLYNKGTGQFSYKLAYKRKLKYIESTGNQYLNSGINAENNLEVHFIGHWMNSNTYNNVSGARSGSPYDILGFLLVSADNVLGIFYNYHGLEYATGFLFSQYGSSKHKWISHMYKGEQWVSVDGIRGTVRQINDSCNCHLPLYIFARNQDGTANYFGVIRMYDFKIYKNGKLVLHLIPVLDENDVPCMYDEVTRKLLYNQGTGQFLYN